MQAVNEKYAVLPDHDLGEHWYDSIKLKESASKRGKKYIEQSLLHIQKNILRHTWMV